MSGKVHCCIGLITISILSVSLAYLGLIGLDNKIVAYLTIGAILGSFIVDIDSTRSKASQVFNRILTYCSVGFFIFYLTGEKLPSVTRIYSKINYILGSNKAGLYLFIFLILIVLGHMSPHRGFTHKVLGTSCFLIMGYLVFNVYVFVGFMVGYVMHILADKLTPEGLKFFEIRFPFQNSKGKLDFHF